MERIVLSKASALVERGHEVHIVLTTSFKPPFFPYDSRIRFHEIGLVTDKISKKSLQFFLQRMEEILLDIKPDIAIAIELGHSKYLYKVKDASKKIIEIHFSKYKRKTTLAKIDSSWWGKMIAHCFTYNKLRHLRQYDKVVVLTHEDRKHWYELDNVTVIHNMVPTVHYTSQIDYASKQIIGVGRYTGQKGWEYMIRIWAKIAQYYPDWRVMIYGSGHKKAMLSKMIQEYGLEDSFILNSPVKGMLKEYLKSSIFVSTSRYEGQPMVLLEAMNAGLAPISFTYQCGPRDIICDGENGLLVDLFDVDTFAQKLTQLMDSEELRRSIGQKARQSLNRFSEDVVIEQWINLFNSLCKKTN